MNFDFSRLLPEFRGARDCPGWSRFGAQVFRALRDSKRLPPRRCNFSWSLSLLLLFTNLAHAQTSQFLFDDNGNLQVQSANLNVPPQITGQPQNRVAGPGDLSSFSVVAKGALPLTFQWQFNGTDIGGATGDALFLQNVSTNNEGEYRVVVTNPSGSVTSAPAFLAIDSDGDGLGDSWEMLYFGDLDQNANRDPDDDGSSNIEEFLNGTDPTDRTSFAFRLVVFSDAGTVIKTPDQIAYTNGQSVTLTAIPPPNGAFHAWLGGIVTRNNPVTLVMTNDKIVLARFTPIIFTWKSAADGDWDTADNWTPNLAPGSNDTAIISRGVTVTLNTPAHCANVTLGSGNSFPTLTGSGTLRVRGKLAWISGSMSGSGRTVIETGANLEFNPLVSTVPSLSGRTLENGGTALWNGDGNLALISAVLTNRAGALFEVQSGASFAVLGSSRFDNAGTFRKSATNGTLTVPVGISFNNSGTVEVQTGALRLAGGGLSSGLLTATNGTLVEWTAGTFLLNAGAQLDGDGLYKISGTATVTGNGTSTIGNLDLVAGTLDGTGTVTIRNALNWTGGTMSGSGRTIIAEGVTLNLATPSGVFLNTRTLENGGTVLGTGGGVIGVSFGGIITNRAGALFHVQNTSAITVGGGGGNRFDNAGTFRKSANAGTMTIASGLSFNNSGTVEIQTGTLNLGGGGTHSGSFDVPGGTALILSGGTHAANGSSSITGAGQFMVSGGAATLAGLVNVTGSNTFNGGTAVFTGNTICTNNTITISGALGGTTADFSGTGLVSPAVLHLINATLTGTSPVTVNNVMNWTGGEMSGSGRTIIPAGATLNAAIPSVATMTAGRTLENGGTLLWTGGGNIGLFNGAVITNRAGALFHAQTATTLGFFSNNRFDNAGTFRKSANNGTLTLGSSGGTFNNFGTVEVQTGTLLCSGGFNNSGAVNLLAGTTNRLAVVGSASGSFTAPVAALVEWTGGAFTLNPGAQLNGAGLYKLNGGNVTADANLTVENLDLVHGSSMLRGSGTVTIANVMNWPLGTMDGSGRIIISAGATLQVGSANGVNLQRTLENAGTAIWTGAGTFILLNGVITNRAGALFHAQNAATFFPIGGCRFDNAGTFRKSANAGTTTFASGLALNNSGTVDIRNGILAANGGYISSPSALLNCVLGGTAPGTGYGQLQVAGSVALAGNLSVALTNNFIPLGSSLFTVLSAGSRSGSFANFFFPADTELVMSNTPSSVVVLSLGPYFATTTLPDAMRNAGYTQQVAAVMNNPPIAYAVIAGALPPGLSFSASGLISGIPTEFGDSTFTIQASNATGVTIQQAFLLKVRKLPPEGLISWWRAENNALDSMSTNHGVLTNGTSFAAGNVGQTFALDGVNDHVHVPDSPSLRPSSITLEAWAMFNAQNGPVFCKPLGPATGDSFALFLQSGTLHGFIHDASAAGVLVSSPSTLALGQWHHVAFTFDDATKEQALYVNGVRVATSQSNRSIGYDNKPVLLGQDINNGVFDFPLNGRIDEASIYNRALSSNEIAAIFLAGSAGKPLNAPYIVTPARLPDAVQMAGYTQQVSAVLGTSPITFSTPSGGLPLGLNLSSAGTINGIPLLAGTSSFLLRATDALGAFSDQQTTLRVIHPAAAPHGLISWWRAEGNALDSAGINHGTASNGVVFVAGKVGQGFGFDGINDFVNVPDAANLRPASITLEAWAKFNGTQGPVLGRSFGSAVHNSYIIWQLSGNLNGTIGDASQGADILSVPFTPVPGQWYHVAFTFDDDSNQQALYLNGAVVASGQSLRTIGYDNHPVVIGGDVDNGNVSFLLNGGVDEAAIYNRALTASEVAAIHDAGIAGKHLLTPYEQWKQIFLGDFFALDSGDPDSDGFSNLDEYTADTDPTNSASHLRITGISFVPAGVALHWQGGIQATQYLQSTFDLSAAASWTDIFTNLPPTASPSGYTNPPPANATQFFRLRVLR